MCLGHVSLSLFFFKAAFASLDLLVGLFVFLLLKYRGEAPGKAFLYLWNPLVLVSFSLDGHYDSLVLALLFFSFYLFSLKRMVPSSFFLALSFLSKFFPVFLLPFLIQHSKKWAVLFVFLGTVLIFSLPFFSGAGPYFLEGLLAYSKEWRFNDSLFWVAAEACRALSIHFPFLSSIPLGPPKALIATLYLAVLAFFLWKKKDRSLLRVSFWALGFLLLLSPTFHYWYLAWLAPFLAFFPNPAWLWLTGAIMVSQEVLIDFSRYGQWEEKGWIKTLEFLPFYLLLFYGYFRSIRVHPRRP